MGNVEIRRITLSGVELTYEIERKNVKNTNLRIRNDGSIYVSANRRVSIKEIENFLYMEEGFILNAINKVKKRRKYDPKTRSYEDGERFYYLGETYTLRVERSDLECVDIVDNEIILNVRYPDDKARKMRLLSAWFTKKAGEIIQEVVEEVDEMYGNRIKKSPDITLKNMNTRWGSCNKAKYKISLSYNLIKVPLRCIYYVVIHEYAHLLVPNHSADFWAVVSEYMPDWKIARKEMRSYE
ncbi:MAG: M48 family metallopeptidase [Lachnospiraceae bacterium]|nr:M48 family metallopeptidase [Lachnospiraceae bacterium]